MARDGDAQDRGPDAVAVVAGLIFIALGVMFLLERADVIDVEFDFDPAVLFASGAVVIGLWLLITAAWRSRR